jgi:two-component sensor histidine kinase
LTSAKWWAADQRAIEQVKASGVCRTYEKEFIRKDGSLVPVLVGAALFEQSPHEGVAFVLDVSERKQAEARQALLVEELNHRVKNTLATVQAIAAHTLRTAASPERFIEAFEGRLRALSQTHNLLNRSYWAGASLHEVLAQELAPHALEDRSRFRLSGDNVRLGPIAAVTLGMAFHELVTNAAKYGALSVPAGHIQVVWRSDGKGRLKLDWQEEDGPSVQQPRCHGFGSRLIEQILASELDGEVHLDFAEKGVRCTMDMALDRVSAH